jgi:hypothetical protein
MFDMPIAFQVDQDYVDQSVEIIRGEFEQGLRDCCQESSLERHYWNFVSESDPIMSPLIEGMKNKKLERTFVSYSRIYHTIATRSRFWLTASLVKIILMQTERFGTPVSHVFTRKSLANHGLDWNRTIANMGDDIKEHLIGGTGNKKWKVKLGLKADDRIGELGRDYRSRYDDAPQYSPLSKRDSGFLDMLTHQDQAEIDTVLSLLGRDVAGSGGSAIRSPIPLECDLLVVSPHKASDHLSVVAIRFVNPKTFKDKARIIEARLNLLQLKAFLAQQKPERSVESINTWICEIVDRNIDRGYPFFSPLTYRNATQFWDDFIRVPFHRVREAMEEIGQEVLARSLTDLLPY